MDKELKKLLENLKKLEKVVDSAPEKDDQHMMKKINLVNAHILLGNNDFDCEKAMKEEIKHLIKVYEKSVNTYKEFGEDDNEGVSEEDVKMCMFFGTVVREAFSTLLNLLSYKKGTNKRNAIQYFSRFIANWDDNLPI